MPGAEKPEKTDHKQITLIAIPSLAFDPKLLWHEAERSQLHAGCPWASVNKSNLKTIFLWWLKI